VHFAKRALMWQILAAGTTAIAASLVGVIVVQLYQPDILPNALRPAIRTQVVQVQAAPPPIPAQYVAVLQRDGSSPAFILTVDAATKNFTVRKVGATTEPGKSYELWLVSDKLQRPRSLGVIGSNDFTIRPALSAYDIDTVNKATYAVTVEPEGGSPTGVATGPIVFTGKLVESVPSAAPPR
jgi:anti-sigma-K factor RskA